MQTVHDHLGRSDDTLSISTDNLSVTESVHPLLRDLLTAQTEALRESEPFALLTIHLIDIHCPPHTPCLSPSCLHKDPTLRECRGHRHLRPPRSCPSLARTPHRRMMAARCANPRDTRLLCICRCHRKRRIWRSRMTWLEVGIKSVCPCRSMLTGHKPRRYSEISKQRFPVSQRRTLSSKKTFAIWTRE